MAETKAKTRGPIRVALGNRDATHSLDNGETREPMPKGKRATIIDGDESQSGGDLFTTITHPNGVWANHATPGAVPAWVASNSPALAQLLAEHFGDIEIRDLED